ncbi:MAG: 6-hydroxymethylpterin diphosphokinase MptE-like protein [bacterium]
MLPGSGALRNIPAVIIAAGPSLRRNIANLRDVHRKALTIVSDTALERVLSEGARPHFTISIDPSDLNERHFPREDYTSTGTWLIYDICCHPTIPERFPGRALTYSARRSPFFEWLDRVCGGKGLIRPGMMVSQAALNVAAFWGCRPIILVGQDLALDPQTGDTHFDGAALKRTVQFITDDRQHVMYPSIDGKESRKEPIYWVDGVHGQPVPTVQYLLDYLRGLEENISVIDVPVVNSTEGGARIAGTTSADLSEALNRYGANKIDVGDFRTHLTRKSSPCDLSAIHRQFQQKIDLLHEATTALFNRMEQLESQAEGWAEETNDLLERTADQVFRDDILSFFVEQVSGQAVLDAHRFQSVTTPMAECDDQVRIRCGRLCDALQHAETVLRRTIREAE